MEAETVGNTRVDPQALVDTMAATIAEVEGETLGDRRSDAQVLVDTLCDTLPEVEADTPGDTRAMRWHWSTVWLTSLQRWWQRH